MDIVASPLAIFDLIKPEKVTCLPGTAGAQLAVEGEEILCANPPVVASLMVSLYESTLTAAVPLAGVHQPTAVFIGPTGFCALFLRVTFGSNSCCEILAFAAPVHELRMVLSV